MHICCLLIHFYIVILKAKYHSFEYVAVFRWLHQSTQVKQHLQHSGLQRGSIQNDNQKDLEHFRETIAKVMCKSIVLVPETSPDSLNYKMFFVFKTSSYIYNINCRQARPLVKFQKRLEVQIC